MDCDCADVLAVRHKSTSSSSECLIAEAMFPSHRQQHRSIQAQLCCCIGMSHVIDEREVVQHAALVTDDKQHSAAAPFPELGAAPPAQSSMEEVGASVSGSPCSIPGTPSPLQGTRGNQQQQPGGTPPSGGSGTIAAAGEGHQLVLCQPCSPEPPACKPSSQSAATSCPKHIAAVPPSKRDVACKPPRTHADCPPTLSAVATCAADGGGTLQGRARSSPELQPTQLEFAPEQQPGPSTVEEVLVDTLPKLTPKHASYVQAVVKEAQSGSVGMKAVGDVLVMLASDGQYSHMRHCVTGQGESCQGPPVTMHGCMHAAATVGLLAGPQPGARQYTLATTWPVSVRAASKHRHRPRGCLVAPTAS
jgi:uncharacterized protein YfcZ (UPF0381/DUF406 family)